LIVRYEKAVLPDTRFESLGSVVLQRARCVARVDLATGKRVLVTPRSVLKFRLEEADETSVNGLVDVRWCIRFEQVEPIPAAS